MEPADCTMCAPAGARWVEVDPACPEHGIPVAVGLLCRCLGCCCPDGQGHKHPDYAWWGSYAAAVGEGQLERQARLTADIETRRRCDPTGLTHSVPHIGCIMR